MLYCNGILPPQYNWHALAVFWCDARLCVPFSPVTDHVRMPWCAYIGSSSSWHPVGTPLELNCWSLVLLQPLNGRDVHLQPFGSNVFQWKGSATASPTSAEHFWVTHIQRSRGVQKKLDMLKRNRSIGILFCRKKVKALLSAQTSHSCHMQATLTAVAVAVPAVVPVGHQSPPWMLRLSKWSPGFPRQRLSKLGRCKTIRTRWSTTSSTYLTILVAVLRLSWKFSVNFSKFLTDCFEELKESRIRRPMWLSHIRWLILFFDWIYMDLYKVSLLSYSLRLFTWPCPKASTRCALTLVSAWTLTGKSKRDVSKHSKSHQKIVFHGDKIGKPVNQFKPFRRIKGFHPWNGTCTMDPLSSNLDPDNLSGDARPW